MELATKLIASISAASDLGANPQILQSLLGELQGVRHVRVIVTNDAARASSYDSLRTQRARSEAPRWFERLMAVDHLQKPRVVAPRGLHGPSVAVIKAEPADEIEEVWRDVRGLLTLAGASVTFLIGLLFLLIHVGLKPLNDLFNGFQRLEDGHFDVRVPVKTVSELERIHRKFNAMAEVLRKTMQDNRMLAKKILNLQEEERRILARDLHDEIGPFLFGIKADTSVIKALVKRGRADEVPPKLESIDDMVIRLQKLVKKLLRRLRPIVIDEHSIRGLIETWQARLAHIEWRLQIADLPTDLDDGVKITLYRIIQECLTNVARHADATRVLVKIEFSGLNSNSRHSLAGGDDAREVRLVVEDNGKGMSPRTRYGLGLIGLQERVQALNGELSVRNTVPHGLLVEAKIRIG
ncbi:MAG: histidine kinase [Gammaproteobacteria bacterium]